MYVHVYLTSRRPSRSTRRPRFHFLFAPLHAASFINICVYVFMYIYVTYVIHVYIFIYILPIAPHQRVTCVYIHVIYIICVYIHASVSYESPRADQRVAFAVASSRAITCHSIYIYICVNKYQYIYDIYI